MDQIRFNEAQTLLAAVVVLFIGQFINNIPFLKKWSLPDPVVGGIVVSLLVMGLYICDVMVKFKTGMGDILMLAFFSTVGLNANLKLLIRGGKGLLIFIGICTVFLIGQDFIGVLMAKVLGLDLRLGLIVGSITLTGGHGTGKVYVDEFAKSGVALPGGLEIAMAAATFGLILGGIMGSPLSRRLIDKFNLTPTAPETGFEDQRKFHQRRYQDNETISTQTLLNNLFMVGLCIVTGAPLIHLLQNALGILIPEFVGALFVGIILCNVLEFSKKTIAHEETLTIIGNISLAIFLAMAMMKIRIWRLADLAGPVAIILAVQAIFMIIFARFITFRIMGRDYDAAVIAGGHCGFGLGSTPTAIANMDGIVKDSGPAPRAFLIVPLVGAFSLDIINALVIQGYLYLPWFSEYIKKSP